MEALTRAEIVGLLKPSKGLSSKKKPELLKIFQAQQAYIEFPEDLMSGFVIVQRSQTLEFLLFLYFGKQSRNLQAMTLRDLGIIKTRTGQTSFEVRFATPEAARLSFFYAKLAEQIQGARGDSLVALAAGVSEWPVSLDMEAVACRDREICRLGARLEQDGFSCQAFEVYSHTTGHPARERTCRILLSMKETAKAKQLLEEMIINPSTDEELLFAEDLHARKFGGRPLSKLTHLLRSAPMIRIDEAFRDSAEKAAAVHFQTRGDRAYRTENHLWKSLFGLLFWDQLQGANGETKHNEFERRPTQLVDGSFFRKNEAAIYSQLSSLHSGTALSHLESVIKAHEGEPNGVFRWRGDTLTLIQVLLEHSSPQALEAILLRMARDPGNNMTGFPDLMVIGETELRFVEIKAEGDQIRRHQLVQLQALEKAGFSVEIVRIGWFADPDQQYVVVDVETTGGRAAFHRITEIGAVKIQSGRVVGKFSSLVNPGRTIPANITRLTGISDDMVAGAPKFSEISESFREFVGQSVFAAHNATFDFGFIREEFRRLGQTFRCPTLCTVVAMRRYFPGLSSYRLAALCQHFGIPLDSHHRALCDAEATAQLLYLINEKRSQSTSSDSPI